MIEKVKFKVRDTTLFGMDLKIGKEYTASVKNSDPYTGMYYGYNKDSIIMYKDINNNDGVVIKIKNIEHIFSTDKKEIDD